MRFFFFFYKSQFSAVWKNFAFSFLRNTFRNVAVKKSFLLERVFFSLQERKVKVKTCSGVVFFLFCFVIAVKGWNFNFIFYNELCFFLSVNCCLLTLPYRYFICMMNKFEDYSYFWGSCHFGWQWILKIVY